AAPCRNTATACSFIRILIKHPYVSSTPLDWLGKKEARLFNHELLSKCLCARDQTALLKLFISHQQPTGEECGSTHELWKITTHPADGNLSGMAPQQALYFLMVSLCFRLKSVDRGQQ
ncbi:Hypothetical predicted protein, partial [Scomber scombrus]